MTLIKFKNISKPFWIPLITLFYFLNSESINFLIIIALTFGYIGDILLMLSKKKFFIAGAFSFMIGHFFYIYVFLNDAGGLGVFANYPAYCVLAFLPYASIALIMKKLLGNNVSSIFVPAVCYFSVILLMSYSAFLRFFNVSFSMAILTFSGSILFIISDSFIVIRKFKNRFKGIEVIVVITYIAAQLLIVSGLS